MNPTQLNAWKTLDALASSRESATSLSKSDIAAEQGGPRLTCGPISVDFSRQQITPAVLKALIDLCEEAGLEAAIEAQFSGAEINTSEQRAVLHTALRAPFDSRPEAVATAIEQELERAIAFATEVRSGQWRGYTGKTIRNLVPIGIGGSHLGPELAHSALASEADPFDVRFLANLDGQAAVDALAGLNPETTLCIIVSKSFTTLETKRNAELVRSWFLERTGDLEAISKHFVSVTTNLSAAAEFGIPQENLFAMWDWVGGRYSMWSAVGMPLLLSWGEAQFHEMLAGAHELDQHLANTPLNQNLPVLMAAIGIWNYNFLDAQSLAVLSYDRRLRLLPDYLQQLEMESNGKSVDREGNPIDYPTMPVLWGGEECNGQHAFHQMLHQGNRAFAADLIATVTPDHPHPTQHAWQLASLLGQAEAMELGEQHDDPNRRVQGMRPTTTILLESLSPRSLGTLLALYEQKVFCQGVLWNVNSFDQWGVELGKRLAGGIYPALVGEKRLTGRQAKTQAVIDHINKIDSGN